MKNIRISACLLWMLAGVMSNSTPGYISAFASVLFLYALIKGH